MKSINKSIIEIQKHIAVAMEKAKRVEKNFFGETHQSKLNRLIYQSEAVGLQSALNIILKNLNNEERLDEI